MKSTRCSLVLLAVSTTFAMSASAYKPEFGESPANLDKHLEFVGGAPLDLVALKGMPTILYFGADWCVPCTEHGRPAVMQVAAKYKSSVRVIFVSMDDNKFRENKIAEERHPEVSIAMPSMKLCPPHKCPDGLRDLGAFGRIYVYPTAILLDSSGQVVEKLSGGRSVAESVEKAVLNTTQTLKQPALGR